MNYLISLGCSVFVLGGVFMCKLGLNAIETAKNSTSWPTTQGMIINSQIITENSDNSISYRPSIEYLYKVGDETYRNNTIFFGDGGGNGFRSYSEHYVNKYYLNRSVRVSYDSKKPNISVLEPGTQKNTYVLFVVGCGFVFMGIWAWLIYWLQLR